MVIVALLFALIAGVPLGVLSYFYPRAGKIILRVVDLIQTTPALALLGIIMVFMGAGKPTVIVGLALYSLLPIVRNTVLGLNQVPSALKEAATGMGMTRMYQLRRVEIPLAAPIIFTGVRIAAVNAIGTAVFAAMVGGGGLGNIINTGIRQNDMKAILSGTGVLMAMALILDIVMALVEHRMNRRSDRAPSPAGKLFTRAVAAVTAVACVALTVWTFLPQQEDGLVLYEGQFSEVQLVNSMIKQLVEDRYNLTVTIKDQMTAVNNFNAMTGQDHSCDLNTASSHLLTYISGLGPQLAQNIVSYRAEHGPFASRRDLLKVPRMGAKAFEQCAGFLRIPDAKNPLDNTAVHPESYGIVEQMAQDLGCTVSELIADKQLRLRIQPERYLTDTVGMPTLKDILQELDKPGRDPRGPIKVFEFDPNVRTLDDLREGMELPGIVGNITNFGAFVDIGIKENGLIHLSQLADRYISDPNEVVSIHQHVRVRVLGIDTERKRIQLTLRGVSQEGL